MMPRESALECPKCKKRGLVRLEHSENDVFECVYCHYKDDLTKGTGTFAGGSPGLIVTALLAVLLTLLVLGI